MTPDVAVDVPSPSTAIPFPGSITPFPSPDLAAAVREWGATYDDVEATPNNCYETDALVVALTDAGSWRALGVTPTVGNLLATAFRTSAVAVHLLALALDRDRQAIF